MKKCKNCPDPIEAEQYEFCKKCWWDQDPRNEKNQLESYTTGKFPPAHFWHDEVVYVPCYQVNPEGESPYFKYDLSDASHDLQQILALEPDYVLTLKGRFDAKTQPVDYTITKYNKKGLCSE